MKKRLILIVSLVVTAIAVASSSTFDILAGARMIIRPGILEERVGRILEDDASGSPERFRAGALYYDGRAGLAMLDRSRASGAWSDPALELRDRVVELEILIGLSKRDGEGEDAARFDAALARCRELDPTNAHFVMIDAVRRLARGLQLVGDPERPEAPLRMNVVDEAEFVEGIRLLGAGAKLPRCQSYRVSGRERTMELLESAGMSRFVALYTSYSRLHHYSVMMIFDLVYIVDAIAEAASGREEKEAARRTLETAITLFRMANRDAHTLLARRVYGNALKQLERERQRLSPGTPAQVDIDAIELETSRLLLYMNEHDPYQLRAAGNQPFLRLLLAFGILMIDLVIVGVIATVTTSATAMLAAKRAREAAQAAPRPAADPAATSPGGEAAPAPEGPDGASRPAAASAPAGAGAESARIASPDAPGGAPADAEPPLVLSPVTAAVFGALVVGLLAPAAFVAWQDARQKGFDITPFLVHVRWRLLPVLFAIAIFGAVAAWRCCPPERRDFTFARFLSDAMTVALLGLTAACFVGVGAPLARERAALEQRLLGAMEDEVGYALDRIRAVEQEEAVGPAGLPLGRDDDEGD